MSRPFNSRPASQNQCSWRQLTKVTALTLTAALVAGCTGALNAPVKKLWTEAIKNYALVPVYPMRENVFVGKLYLAKKNDNDDYTLGSREVAYISAGSEVQAEERAKPTYGKSGAPKENKLGNDVLAYGWEPLPTNFAAGSIGNRLRAAALPGLALVRVSGANATAGLPGPVNRAGGFNFSAAKTLDISLLGIEEASISDSAARALVQREVFGRLGKFPEDPLAADICASAGALGVPLDAAQLSFVSRVFYARGIKYTATGSSAVSAGASSTPAVSGGDTAEGGDAADAGVQPPQAGGGNQSNGAARPVASVPDVNTGEIAPGISSSFRRSSNDTVTQTDIYDYPMAFAVQAMSINGEDLGISCVSGNLRETPPVRVAAFSSPTVPTPRVTENADKIGISGTVTATTAATSGTGLTGSTDCSGPTAEANPACRGE